jgi:outer membrane murein-binding lipoprotein Lpp
MIENMKTIKIMIFLLLVYSIGTTVFFITTNYSNSSSEQINQLNAQIAQLNVQINDLQKDNEDLKAIRALMEKERAEKDEGQKLHKKSLTGVRDQFEGLDRFDTSSHWDSVR